MSNLTITVPPNSRHRKCNCSISHCCTSVYDRLS